MSLGARLKEERKRLGYNQSDFAELAGASKHSQINWEKGASFPNAWSKGLG
jgi:DNA-binding XRE family transcriptional regulator